MKQTHNVRAWQFRYGAGAALAVVALMLVGCQSAPQAEATGHRSVALFAAVMSPSRAHAAPVTAGAHVAPGVPGAVTPGIAAAEAQPASIEFVPMFAAASGPAFSPVRIDLATDTLAAWGTTDIEEDGESLQFLPMFASINSPARWSAGLILGESVIEKPPALREGVRR